jgi:hypothetical protein
MLDAFNTSSAAETGKRAGVDGREIAETIEGIFKYFSETKSGSPALLAAIEKEAESWRAQVAGLRTADQKALDTFFGQPAGKDVKAALAAKGITEAAVGQDEFRNQYFQLSENMKTDPSAYWPGKVVPTLDDYRDILKFDAYRESIGATAGDRAQQLLKRLDAFEGGFGSKHGSGTGLIHQISDYIGSTPRHASETYAEPADVYVDYLNAFHHTYSPYKNWAPSDDLRQVSTSVNIGYGDPDKKNDVIAREFAKLEAAFERGNIKADLRVELGKTYGEDAIKVTMPMDDYLNRYVPILTGKLEIDLTIPDSKYDADINTQETYYGYLPGKQSFYDKEDLVVSAAVLKAIEADFPDAKLEAAADALYFTRAMGALATSPEQWPLAPGVKGDFVRLKVTRPAFNDQVYLFEDEYFSSTDAGNKIAASLSEVDDAVNARAKKEPAARAAKEPDTHVFEHNGDMYLPSTTKSYQIALHMKYKYGVDYTWVIRDKDAELRANKKDKYVLMTGALAPGIRDEAMADLNRKLDEEVAPKELRAATVLKRKMRVGKPLNFRPQ